MQPEPRFKVGEVILTITNRPAKVQRILPSRSKEFQQWEYHIELSDSIQRWREERLKSFSTELDVMVAL